ncbi:PH domain-containing protein [Streptomyces sp. NPDC002328]|uniref:PH domain-containing protein n=1 Tax=Streptomyces sp. NPDC002328 TaxID=3364642 RepID=UPI0036D18705
MGENVRVGAIEREYRGRRRPPAPVLVLLAFALMVTAMMPIMVFSDMSVGVSVWETAVGPLAAWVFFIPVALAHWRARTLVSAQGITVRGRLLTRTRPWRDVYALRTDPRRTDTHSLEPRLPVHLYDTEGRRYLLPHLDDWQLDDVEGELTALRETATRDHGVSWEPRPEVEARIHRRAGHRKAWRRSHTGATAALAATFAYGTVRLFVSNDDPFPLTTLLYVPAATFALLAAALHGGWELRLRRARTRGAPVSR